MYISSLKKIITKCKKLKIISHNVGTILIYSNMWIIILIEQKKLCQVKYTFYLTILILNITNQVLAKYKNASCSKLSKILLKLLLLVITIFNS